MAGIPQNGQKRLILIVVPLLRIENVKERWVKKKKKKKKKIETYIQSIKIYVS